MKLLKLTLLTVSLMVFILIESSAQVETPSASPLATLSQKVGLTDVTIEYSRPSMRGRKIFGDLVPYGKIWRTGANMATKLTFADDVTIGGKALKAGTYALFTIPGENEWTVIFNTNYRQGGTGNYKESEDVVRVTVKPEKMPVSVETFLIILEEVTNTSAVIGLLWENTYVPIALGVSIDDRVMASIQRSLTVNPNNYVAAANYYRESGKDLKQALAWIDEAIKSYEASGMNAFWVYRQKSLIEADMKNYKAAIATAKIGAEKAKTANNDDYVKMNNDSIAEWSKK